MADELLSAYVDGVAELDPADRKRLEQRLRDDPALRGDVEQIRAVLGQLRALPSEGGEPDWTRLEGAIRAAVGPDVPSPWWRRWRWRWLAPCGALATTVAVMVLWLHPPTGAPGQRELAPHAHDVAPATPTALWLDGQLVDIGELDEAPLDELEPAALADDGELTGGLLPAANLDWVDQLDDSAVDRAERWLAENSHPGKKS
jgi:hypothetical protein